MKYGLNLFGYDNYRRLLEDFYEAKNQSMQGRYSYRAFAKEAGFASPNYIRLIIEAKRNLSLQGIDKLAEVLKLSKRGRDFFEPLVHFNQAATACKRDYYFKKICAFREFSVGHPLLQAQYDYLSKWYYAAVRELVSLPTFRMNPAWVCRALAPRITEKEAKEALTRLKELKLIEKNKETSKWHLSAAHLHTDKDMLSGCAVHFHRDMLTQAAGALESPATSRFFSAITMAIDSQQFEEVRHMAAKFIEDVRSYLADHPGSPERVCQFNAQFFHLSAYLTPKEPL